MYPRRALARCPKEARFAAGQGGGVFAVVVAYDCELRAALTAIVLPFDFLGSAGTWLSPWGLPCPRYLDGGVRLS